MPVATRTSEFNLFVQLLYDWTKLDIAIRHDECGLYISPSISTNAICHCESGLQRNAMVAVWR